MKTAEQIIDRLTDQLNDALGTCARMLHTDDAEDYVRVVSLLSRDWLSTRQFEFLVNDDGVPLEEIRSVEQLIELFGLTGELEIAANEMEMDDRCLDQLTLTVEMLRDQYHIGCNTELLARTLLNCARYMYDAAHNYWCGDAFANAIWVWLDRLPINIIEDGGTGTLEMTYYSKGELHTISISE